MQLWLYKLILFSSCIERGVQSYLRKKHPSKNYENKIVINGLHLRKTWKHISQYKNYIPNMSEMLLCKMHVQKHLYYSPSGRARQCPWMEKWTFQSNEC